MPKLTTLIFLASLSATVPMAAVEPSVPVAAAESVASTETQAPVVPTVSAAATRTKTPAVAFAVPTNSAAKPTVVHPWKIGIAAAGAFHSEAGLDSSKGQYAVSYSTFGGNIFAQYHFEDFYLEGGVGMLRLLSLTVNSMAVNMDQRAQWHILVHAYGFFKLTDFIGIGGGLTHLTETTLYLNSMAVPNSSYNHLFADAVVQCTPQITERLRLAITAIVGINLIPGRQHTYSIGDLLHVRAQFNLGATYDLF